MLCCYTEGFKKLHNYTGMKCLELVWETLWTRRNVPPLADFDMYYLSIFHSNWECLILL